jgi:hypothetical protein
VRASYSGFLAALRDRLLVQTARLPLEVRRDILDGRILSEPLNNFVVRVRANASSIGPTHVS